MKKYVKLLSCVYILMLLPQVLCSTIFNSSKLMPTYIACYSAATMLLSFYFIKNKVSARKKELKYIIIYFVILLLTFVSDSFFGVSIAQNDFFDMIVKIINMAFLMCFMPKDEYSLKDFKPLFLSIFIIGIISGIYNIVTNYSLILNFSRITNSYEVNFSSFFANRNTYGTFLFLTIFCTFFLYLFDNKKKIYVLGLFFFGLNLLFTMSRGSILTTIIFGFSYYFYSSNQKKSQIIVYVILFTLLLGIGFIILKNNPRFSSFIMKYFVRADVGTSGRGDLWVKGMNIAFSHNIFNGVGFYTGIGMTNGDIQFHSFFVDTIVDSGLLGLFFKLFVLFKSYCYVKSYSKKNNNKNFYNYYKSAFVALVFLGIFESVNFFSLGFTETEFTLMFITIPWFLGGT